MSDIEDPRVDPKNRYRHRRTGDLGYLYQDEEAGELMVRYAHGEGSARVRYNERDWAPEDENLRQLHRGARAQIAFAADQAFCAAKGRYQDRRRWEQLEAHEREKWCDPSNPPMRDIERSRLYIFVHRGCLLPTREPPPDPPPETEEQRKAREAHEEAEANRKALEEWAAGLESHGED